ncbi:MAG: helix-turn-helix transcriptional regulator [Chitinophagaceae bacterium]
MKFPVIFNTIILLGAIQGFILCFLLFLSGKNRLPDKLLAWIILLISLASIKLYGTENGWFDHPVMRWVDAFVPLIVVMPLGPLIYFYIRATLNPGFTIGRKQKRHFYTALIDIVPQVTAIIFIVGLFAHVFVPNPGPWGIFIDNYNVYSDIPRWISISVYIFMSSRLLSKQPSGKFKWLRQVVKAFRVFQVIWLLYLIPYVIPKYTGFMLDTFNWYPVYVPVAILVYWLGIRGYIVSQTESAQIRKSAPLDPGLVVKTINSVRLAMEKDKLYLNPALTVAIVADHTGVPTKFISAVLNQHLQKSFNEFVNEYRISAIRQRLVNGETRELTIAGLAYEGGFNSLPTFQRAFKSVTGQTPSEFLTEKS